MATVLGESVKFGRVIKLSGNRNRFIPLMDEI